MTKAVARNGPTELAYRVHGEAGRPLLLISGNAAQMIHWPDSFVTALRERGFQVAMADNRDAGQSTHVQEQYSLADMAKDTAAVLDVLGWESAHLMGISLGGMIGQVLAVHHPSRVRSLTTMAAAPGWGWRISRPRLRTALKVIATSRADDSSREGAAEVAVRLRRLIGSPGYPFDEAETRETARQAYDIAHDPAGAMRQLTAARRSGDRRTELARVSAPTLVVHGEDDPLQSLHAGRATAEAIPGARLLTFPGVGHDLVPPPLWPEFLDAVVELADYAEFAR